MPVRGRQVVLEDAIMLPEFVTRKQLGELLGVSLRSVDRYVRSGLLPHPIRLGHKTIRWFRSDVEDSLVRLQDRAEESVAS